MSKHEHILAKKDSFFNQKIEETRKNKWNYNAVLIQNKECSLLP